MAQKEDSNFVNVGVNPDNKLLIFNIIQQFIVVIRSANRRMNKAG